MEISKKAIEMILADQQLDKSKLSEKIGCNRSWLSQVISRESCRPATAGRIARGLGVPVSEILKEDKE